jgi:hypothetical protein
LAAGLPIFVFLKKGARFSKRRQASP